MSFPHTYHLKRPLYAFSADGSRTHRDKHRGLLTFSPLQPATTPEPRCLFIFTEDDSDHANRLYLALRNGIARFPGCKRLVGISLEKLNVEPVRVAVSLDKPLGASFYRAVLDRLEKDGSRPDFAFVIYSKEISSLKDDPYPGAKAALASHGIASQYVSWELLNSEQQFRYAISNLALSFFVKLGGIPWSIALQKREPTLVFGIGHSRTVTPAGVVKLTGFATCVLSNGVYMRTAFFPPATSEDEFLEALRSGLRAALASALKDRTSGLERVTFHVSQFERREVIRTIAETVQEFEQKQGLVIPFELVRLNEDSDFTVIDLSHPGYVSEEGTIVALGAKHALIVTEGRRETDVWRGRKPVTLELKREYASAPQPSLRQTIEDALFLSSVNWRGFNAVTQPITLQYARLLTNLVGKMALCDPSIGTILQTQHSLNAVPWFI